MIYLCTGPAALDTRETWLPILQRAVDESDGRWSSEQLLADVYEGKVLVWIVGDGADVKGCFTTRVVKGAITWVLIEECAGRAIHEWILEALHAVENWARELGATQIVAEGRMGWQKMLKPYGYTPSLVACVKRLETLN